jgi:hypothetical protein
MGLIICQNQPEVPLECLYHFHFCFGDCRIFHACMVEALVHSAAMIPSRFAGGGDWFRIFPLFFFKGV